MSRPTSFTVDDCDGSAATTATTRAQKSCDIQVQDDLMPGYEDDDEEEYEEYSDGDADLADLVTEAHAQSEHCDCIAKS